jgi:cell wall-associated NlpC family hydrolase
MFAALCVAVLAGCASPRQSADVFIIDDQDVALALLSNDPIGTLASRKQARVQEAPSSDSSNPMIGEALDQLGIRYSYGGSSPDTGFDCSGLVAYSAQHGLGLKLPRNSSAIALMGASVDKTKLQPGDLVFFNTLGRRYSHVGIYLGEDKFVHSPSAGGVVRIEKMSMRYWAKRYNGARRLEGNLLATNNKSSRR